MTTPERETVAALAAQVADLRHQLVQAGIASARLASDLGGRVDELADALATALEDDGAIAPLAPYFLDLEEDEFRDEAEAVAAWVDGVLLPNYPGYTESVIRPCWPHHPEALWELATLRAEWRRVYDRRKPELAGALSWHDRWLPGVLARLRLVMKSCNAVQCRARK